MTVNFRTRRGNVYEYKIFDINSGGWNAVAGNYMFAYKNRDGKWHPLYIGQTVDFSDRLPQHEKKGPALQRGATHILAHVNKDERARLAEEAELIADWQPVLNDKLK